MNPADTINFGEAIPAHRLPRSRNNSRLLWIIAALLVVTNVLLLLVVIVKG